MAVRKTELAPMRCLGMPWVSILWQVRRRGTSMWRVVLSLCAQCFAGLNVLTLKRLLLLI